MFRTIASASKKLMATPRFHVAYSILFVVTLNKVTHTQEKCLFSKTQVFVKIALKSTRIEKVKRAI